MKLVYLAIIPLLCLNLSADEITGKVIKIADGDTLTILDRSQQQHRIRLSQIDAPEKSQAFGQQSKQSLSSICFGKNAIVNVEDTDRYGRIVGTVVCNGTHANRSQLETGMAWVYDKYAKDRQYYNIQRAAQSKHIGLWSDAQPVAPWEYRKHTRAINN